MRSRSAYRIAVDGFQTHNVTFTPAYALTSGATVVSIGDAQLVEADTANRNLTFPVRLSRPAGAAVSVSYTTANGTATATFDVTLDEPNHTAR